jgi:hypothetical protein
MRLLKLKSGTCELWETTKELPARRYNDFQKYLIQDIGIGSEVVDIERHHQNLFRLLGGSQIQEAQTESYNLFQNIVLAIQGINIKHISFACFVHSINGKAVTDYSESNLKNVINKLSDIGLTQGHVEDILEDLKKKLIPNYV